MRSVRGLGKVIVVLLNAFVIGACSSAGTPSGAPSVVFGPDAGRADWWVAPADLPLDPETRVIHGLLEERSCASGSSPEGRIIGPAIEYRDDAVIITFKVREIGGRCPGNPHFPITIELAEPLGARGVFDGGVNPHRDATIDPTIIVAPDEDCGPLIGTDDTKIACIGLIEATLGDRYQEFAEVRVTPAEDDCPGDTCTVTAAIEARTWIVEASTLDGNDFRWTCTYSNERATCTLEEAT